MASSAVAGTKAEVASCLSARDVAVNAADPVASFFGHLDGGLAGADEAARRSEKRRLTDAFVACTGSYFAAIEAALRPQRDRLVEQHRPLLERFAAEVSAAGYIPSTSDQASN